MAGKLIDRSRVLHQNLGGCVKVETVRGMGQWGTPLYNIARRALSLSRQGEAMPPVPRGFFSTVEAKPSPPHALVDTEAVSSLALTSSGRGV